MSTIEAVIIPSTVPMKPTVTFTVPFGARLTGMLPSTCWPFTTAKTLTTMSLDSEVLLSRHC